MSDLTTVPAPPALNSHDARLAVELAIQISDLPTICKRYGVSTDELKKKLKDPMFRGAVKEAKRQWSADLNAKERIRVKSQLLVEDTILDVFSIIKDRDQATPARLDAFKSLTKISGVETLDKTTDTGARFVLNISLPNLEKPVIIDATPNPERSEG